MSGGNLEGFDDRRELESEPELELKLKLQTKPEPELIMEPDLEHAALRHAASPLVPLRKPPRGGRKLSNIGKRRRRPAPSPPSGGNSRSTAAAA
eukprot:COSAG01_NODE_63223_length_281_cov_0.483516_1_plen_93_part_11